MRGSEWTGDEVLQEIHETTTSEIILEDTTISETGSMRSTGGTKRKEVDLVVVVLVAQEAVFHMQEVVEQEVLSKDTEEDDLLLKADLNMDAQMRDLHSTVEEAVNEPDSTEDPAMTEDHSLETERHQETQMAAGKTLTKDPRDLATILATGSSEWTRCATSPSKSFSQRHATTSTERSKSESTEIKETDHQPSTETSLLSQRASS